MFSRSRNRRSLRSIVLRSGRADRSRARAPQYRRLRVDALEDRCMLDGALDLSDPLPGADSTVTAFGDTAQILAPQASYSWTRYPGNPVVTPPGTYVTDVSVLQDATGYKMWYGGSERIYAATSSDGLHWTKYPSPVLWCTQGWEGYQMGSVFVMKQDSLYRMWYSSSTGTSARMGYAQSQDGFNWTKPLSQPVLDVRAGMFDARAVEHPFVLFEGNVYKMWYSAQRDASSPGRCTIGYATSTDGKVWTRLSSPVLVPTAGTFFSGTAAGPFVVHEDTGYTMYLSGSPTNSIGHVHSSDSVHWDTASAQVDLQPAGGSSWDAYGVSCPFIVNVGRTPTMYYNGVRQAGVNPDGIGIAQAARTAPPVQQRFDLDMPPPPSPGQKNLVLYTHGRNTTKGEFEGNVRDEDYDLYVWKLLHDNLEDRVPADWQVFGLDWTDYNKGGFDTVLDRAVQIGRQFGDELPLKRPDGSLIYEAIHLIGFSAGAGLINEAAERIRERISTSNDPSPAPVVHTTFLDPFGGIMSPIQDTYGEYSTWSDHYFAHDHGTFGFTDYALPKSYNVDVTLLDWNKTTRVLWDGSNDVESHHGWPIVYYASTIPEWPGWPPEYGYPRSMESWGWDGWGDYQVENYPVDNDPPKVLGGEYARTGLTYDTPRTYRVSGVSALVESMSTTGTITLGDTSIAMTTGSPVWVSMTVPITEPMNFVTLKADFVSEIGSEGLFAVYLDDEPILVLDERYVDDGVQDYALMLPELDPGDHSLAFRLDPYTAVPSSAIVDEIQFGYLETTENYIPQITSASVTPILDEGSEAMLSVEFRDADASDSHTATIDWGDGTTETLTIDVGVRDFSRSHCYLDDSGTGAYLIRVTVSDQHHSDSETAAVTVNNVPPTLVVSGESTVMLGDPFLLTLTATDVSPLDQAGTFTYCIDWNGDGTVDNEVPGLSTATVSHTFAQAGTFNVSVTATDKDGGQSAAATHSILVKIPVQIEIKPGDTDPSLNLASNGRIAVAVYTTADFDARTIDASTVVFAGAHAVKWSYEDLDSDGDLDLVMHFETQKTNLQAVYTDLLLADFGLDDVLDSTRQEATVTLTGETTDGLTLEGSDQLNVFLSGKKLRELLDQLHAQGLL